MFGKSLSLRQRLGLTVLLPVCVLLITFEFIGFRSMRTMLIDNMYIAGSSHLVRAAKHIDARLHLPKVLLTKLVTESSPDVRNFLADTVRSIAGVTNLTVNTIPVDVAFKTRQSHKEELQAINVHYAPLLESKQVTLYAEKEEVHGASQRFANLVISFYDLIGPIPEAPWMSGVGMFIIDADGDILPPELTSTDELKLPFRSTGYISEATKQQLLEEIAVTESGAIITGGTPPERIYAFHKLREAPWSMVMVFDGAALLQPVKTFRNTYLGGALIVTTLILFLLNIVANRVIRTARLLSKAAGRLAEGHFDDKPLETKRNDEIGKLIQSFNEMSQQLQEGVQLQESMAIAGEIQKSLLPQNDFKEGKFEASGLFLPCNAAGGDFFDIHPCPDGSLYLSVGDVVGHGVGAALLMATTKALVRSEIEHTSDLPSCVARVNNLLYKDARRTGSFTTLFLIRLDSAGNSVQWVRAGHEPAMLYNLQENSFTELRGNGVALGVAPDLVFQENGVILEDQDYLICIGSDGLTDIENENGERFGRDRLEECIREFAQLAPRSILENISQKISTFSNHHIPADDITAVIVRIR